MISDELAKALADAVKQYINERKDNRHEAFLKEKKPKKNKQGVVTNGAFNVRLSALVKPHCIDQEQYVSIEKSKRIKDQSALSFQQEKYESLLSLVPEDTVDVEILDLKREYQEFVAALNTEHTPVVWLNTFVPKAKDISFATHVGKLTHSSSKSSSILDATEEKNNGYLSTNQLSNPVIDTASSNAASLPIASVMQLSVKGISVLDCLKSDDRSFLRFITDDENLIDSWCTDFKQAYDTSEKSSYFLSKQIYFPVSEGEYHLLMPLKSSSLVQALHLEHKKYWSEEQELTRKQRSVKKYSPVKVRSYPNKAYLNVTGSNHSNASSLNGQRGGRISLLPMMPPAWSSKGFNFTQKHTLFDRQLARELKHEIEALKTYLVLLKSKELSLTEPTRHAAVVSKLNAITYASFDYFQLMQMSQEKGWTINTALPLAQQLMIDPERNDEAAVLLKNDKQWQDQVSQEYGKWLNKQLMAKSKLSLKPIHREFWSRYFLILFKEHVALQEVSV